MASPSSILQVAPASSAARRPVWTGRTVCEFLTPAEFAEWDRFVSASPHGTVFHFSWWLSTASRSFRLLVVRNEFGDILGGIPLPQKRVAGLRLLHAPALAPYLGPIFDLSATKGTCDQLHLMRTCGEILARNLGAFDSLRFMAGAQAPDLQGFLWAHFRVSLAYTFRFSACADIQKLTEGITRTHLQKLSKAKRLNLSVDIDRGIEALIELNKMTFERKESKPPFEPDLPLRLWQAAEKRGCARLYIARMAGGLPVAGLLTVHDSRTTYQIVSGFNPSHMDVPGQNLLLWTAIQDSLAAGRDFDFEGSSIRGVETFYRRWGANAVPVWRIEKTGSVMGSLAHLALRYRESKGPSKPVDRVNK